MGNSSDKRFCVSLSNGLGNTLESSPVSNDPGTEPIESDLKSSAKPCTLGAETGLTDGGKVGCPPNEFCGGGTWAIGKRWKGAAVDGAYDVDIGGGLVASLAIPGAIGLKPEGAVLGGAAKGVEAGLIGKFG
nr:hypothetical protein Itr_chr07CG11060 [Ipomoea trifida]